MTCVDEWDLLGLPDSWEGWTAGAGAVGLAVRALLWYWRQRRHRTTATRRFFAWVARRVNVEILLALLTIKYQTAQARIDQLEAAMRDAGVAVPTDSASPGGERSSYDLPESTLARSRTTGTGPSATTPGPPVSGPR